MSDETSILELFKDDYSLFIEAGFLAIKQSDEIAARRLFKAAEALNPGHSSSQLGFGYIALNKLQITEAASIFEAIVKKEPDHHLARALLGIAYLLTKDKKKRGEALIQEARAHSEDPTIHNLARVSLEWANKDLSPAHLPPLKATLAKVDE